MYWMPFVVQSIIIMITITTDYNISKWQIEHWHSHWGLGPQFWLGPVVGFAQNHWEIFGGEGEVGSTIKEDVWMCEEVLRDPQTFLLIRDFLTQQRLCALPRQIPKPWLRHWNTAFWIFYCYNYTVNKRGEKTDWSREAKCWRTSEHAIWTSVKSKRQDYHHTFRRRLNS